MSIVALAVGAGVGLIVAVVMTFLDWRLNPGGVFEGAQGADWAVVTETALSWFVPVAVLVSAVSLPLIYGLRRLFRSRIKRRKL